MRPESRLDRWFARDASPAEILAADALLVDPAAPEDERSHGAVTRAAAVRAGEGMSGGIFDPAIVDVTDPAAVRYRFALLVDPVVRDGRSDFDPVAVHAGGLAWFGDHLYVPDTSRGLRVFDLGRILAVDAGADRLGHDPATGAYHAHGYRYVIPRSTPTPPPAAAARGSPTPRSIARPRRRRS